VVISVERRQLLSTAQPQSLLEVYRDALLNKYGKPVEEVVAGNKAMRELSEQAAKAAREAAPAAPDL